jgi:hypothetical protein
VTIDAPALIPSDMIGISLLRAWAPAARTAELLSKIKARDPMQEASSQWSGPSHLKLSRVNELATCHFKAD